MRNYAIGHFDDIDGIASHVILERNGRREGNETVHVDIDYSNMDSALEGVVRDISNGQIVRMFDVGHNKDWETPGFLKTLKEIRHFSGNGVEIYDHHVWPEESKVYQHASRVVVPREGDNLTRLCASEIVNFFFGGSDVGGFLSRVANRNDFGDESIYHSLREYSGDLEAAIKAADKGVTELTSLDIINYFSESSIWGDLIDREIVRSPEVWPASFEKAKINYGNALESAKKELDKTISIGEMGSYDVVIGFGEQILHMKGGVDHLKSKYPGADVHACVYEDGSIIFFRDSEKVDLSILGRAFGGGGREAGAGGFVPEAYRKDQGQTRTYVRNTIESALS